jgi:antitoxin component YwqK of YwqJK toxin-antitoxin module
MKTHILLLFILLICSCGRKEPVNEFEQLVERQGLYYQPHSHQPFTGTIEEKYKDSQIHRRISLVDGKVEGPMQISSGMALMSPIMKMVSWNQKRSI